MNEAGKRRRKNAGKSEGHKILPAHKTLRVGQKL